MFVSHILPLSRCHDRPDMGDRWGKIAKTQIAQNIQILHLYVILESLNPIYAATSAAPVNVQATTRTRSTQSQLAGATSVVHISFYLWRLFSLSFSPDLPTRHQVLRSALVVVLVSAAGALVTRLRPSPGNSASATTHHATGKTFKFFFGFFLFISYLTSCSSDSWHFYIFGVSDFNSDQPDHSSDRHLGSCAVVGVTANVESASRSTAKNIFHVARCCWNFVCQIFFTWRDVAEIFFANDHLHQVCSRLVRSGLWLQGISFPNWRLNSYFEYIF